MRIIETPEKVSKTETKYSSIEFLQSLELPKINERLSPYLKLNWLGNKGMPAKSAIDAIKNDKGEPKIVFSLIYNSTIVEDIFLHNDMERELRVFSETVEELLL